MEKVEVTMPFASICHMQVCAEKDATDEEILAVCNAENPSGTSAGWVEVVRYNDEHPNQNPGPCSDHPERLHFLIVC